MPAKAKRSHGTSMEKMSKEISTRSLLTCSAGSRGSLVIGANGSQPFEFGEAVVLENPSIIARSHETRSDGMNNLLLMADGIYRESDVCLEDKPDDGSVDELVEEYLVKHGYSIMKRDE